MTHDKVELTNTPNLVTSSYLDIVAEVVGHDATQDVERDVGACVTQMWIVIHSWTACVPGHFIGVIRNKLILVASEGVEDAKFGLFVCYDKKEWNWLVLMNNSWKR